MRELNSNLRRYTQDKCPECGQKTKYFVYGLIRGDLDENFIRGGCSITPGYDPVAYCESCDLEIGFGGRDYRTHFVLDAQESNLPSSPVRTEIDLMQLSEPELIKYATNLIEARHELLHRGFPADELKLLELAGGWKSFPLESIFDIWFYWNVSSRLIEFAAVFSAHGIKHIHGIYRPDRENIQKLRSLEYFQRTFSQTENPGLRAWNLRPPITRSQWRNPEHELIQLMRSGKEVSESIIQRFANPVPDNQMWPSWYDPTQEFG